MTGDESPGRTFYHDGSIEESVSKVDDSILKTVFVDKKFMKFYESKYNVSKYSLSPFYSKEGENKMPKNFNSGDI
jgi:hypothetical protein